MRASILSLLALLPVTAIASAADPDHVQERPSPGRAGIGRIVPADLTWTAQPEWLSGAAGNDAFRQKTNHDVARFEVDLPGRGMKWSSHLAEPLETGRYRFAAIRYRCRGERGWSDYTLCALGEREYVEIVSPSLILDDGRFHTLCVPMESVAEKVPRIIGLAVQLQATRKDAFLEIASVTFTNERTLESLEDALPHASRGAFEGFQAVPLGGAIKSMNTRANGSAWCRELGIASWFTEPEITSEGIPFRLVPGENSLLATSLEKREEVAFDIGRATSEVYLLLAARLTGEEEPAFGSGPFQHIRDVDRFRLRLEYDDGSIDECLPYNASTGRFGISRGLQVVVAAANPDKVLRRLVLVDSTTQGAFGIAAVTVRGSEVPLFPQVKEETEPLCPPAPSDEPVRLGFQLDFDATPTLQELRHETTGWNFLTKPCELARVEIDEKALPPEAWKPTATDQDGVHWYKFEGGSGIEIGVLAKRRDAGAFETRFSIRNTGSEPRRVRLCGPMIGPFRLDDSSEKSLYFYPKRGAAFDYADCDYRETYSGLFPLQFIDSFAPQSGRGLTIRTEDTECFHKRYGLRKDGGQFWAEIEFAPDPILPGKTVSLPPVVVTATNGDWHAGMDAYRSWLQSWYRPARPRKPWFREIFNFRQRFLWWLDPLISSDKSRIDLQRAVDEANAHFGGIDYLHIFDWGNCGPHGRIYGRTGDYSPYDYLPGGRDGLRKEIAAIQAHGIPVGLYIEGYLLQETGKLGQRHGKAWQIRHEDGSGMRWPDSTEIMICPGVEAWQEIQASTYATKAKELEIDGFYVDQFGFADEYKNCYAADHGHPVPSNPVRTELACLGRIEKAIHEAKPGIAIYTEESPVDVTSQYQDGSFTYAMNSAQRGQSLVPINAHRFALPSFKTIEILFCDKPTGNWAGGVKWTFFNGEAIWLEGPAEEWFAPQTRETIRKCYRILKENADAFTTLEPTMLIPTLRGGVYANAFPAEDKTVYTLYNARHRTVRGELLSVPHQEGCIYFDAWRNKKLEPRLNEDKAVLNLEIGPMDVGCVIVSGPAATKLERPRE